MVDEVELKALASAIIQRYQFARQHGVTFGGLRDLYEIFGYPRVITHRMYRERYERGGIAARIVEAMPKATWRGEMWLQEDEDPNNHTEFEKAWEELEAQHKVTSTFLRADILSQLSTYAIILIGAPGELHEELPRGKPGELLYLQPFSAGGGPNLSASTNRRMGDIDADATILEFETDPRNARFGKPKYYQIRRQETTSEFINTRVHWSRVLHIADGRLDNEVYGSPCLERVWNLLDDLDKVTGGGAEAFWLRANQGLHLNIDKDFNISEAAKKELAEQAEEYAHQMRRMLRTRGVEIDVLGSDVANFAGPADALLTQIAGAKGIPKRILTGSEMGELASSQDRENWRDQIIGRQKQYAEPEIVRPFVDRLIAYGYLPTPAKGPRAYRVEWPHIQVLTEQEKAEGAARWAGVNSTQGEIVFTNDEIRDKWYGLPPLSEEEKVPAAVKRQEEQAQPKVPNAPLVPTAPFTPPPPKALSESEQEMLSILEEAIASGATNVVDAILGMKRHKYEYSSTQIDVPQHLRSAIMECAYSLPADEISPHEKGIEYDSHITVVYGLHTTDSEAVSKLVEGFGEIDITLGPLGVFEKEDCDVLYATIKSPQLERLWKLLRSNLEYTSDYNTYTPHLTIAYMRKGAAMQYAGRSDLAGLSFTANALTFSSKTGEKARIPLA